MRRLWINRIFILKRSWQIACSLYAFIGLAGLLANLDELIFPMLKTWYRVCIGIAILLIIWIAILVICCVYYRNRNNISILKVLNNHKVFLQYGDLFSEDVIDNTHETQFRERRNLIIPVNCCFDTIVDDDLISSKKIHGIALNNLYLSGKYNQSTLNNLIQEDLEQQETPFEELTVSEKRKGNLKRFPFGTVVEIKFDDKTTYFFVALTEFNSSLHAEIHNRENYLVVLQRIIEYISSRSQGFPTIMPIIGGGLPEISDNEQLMLEVMVKLIKLNKDKINCDLHIVVRESGKDDIPILAIN